MPKKTRTRFSAPEIVCILPLHLLERTPNSDLCDQHGIHISLVTESGWPLLAFYIASRGVRLRSLCRLVVVITKDWPVKDWLPIVYESSLPQTDPEAGDLSSCHDLNRNVL